MARRPSYSVAPGDPRRSRILSLGALLGVVVLAVGGLVLVFPGRDFLPLLRNENDKVNFDLTVAYLRNLIRTDPGDLELRLLLVDKLRAAGDLAGARKALNEAQPASAADGALQVAWDAADLAWWRDQLQFARRQGKAIDISEAARELLVRLQRRVAAVTAPAPLFAAIQSANDLLGLLGPQDGAAKDTARTVVLRLLEKLPTLPAAGMADLTQGASLALGDGRFQLSADLFFAARRKTAQRDARDGLLKQGVRALLASGQPVVAWEAAERESSPLPPGDELHWWLAELALAAAQPKAAAGHLRLVLPLTASPEVLARALTAERLQLAWTTLAAGGDLPAALQLAEAALVTHPGDPVWLERKAQVAEWGGKGPLALAAWVELLKREATERALANVFRLSPMLLDDDALLLAWQSQARLRRLSEAEVRKVVDVYERLGSVDGALQFLRGPAGAGATVGGRWPLLEAELLDRAGRPVEATQILERVPPDQRGPANALRLAQLHLRQGRFAPALAALRAARPVLSGPGAVTPEAWLAHWHLLSDVAYELGERQIALQGLDQLLALGRLKNYQAERAVRLRIDEDRFSEAAAMAARLYPRFPEDGMVSAWLDALAVLKTASGVREMVSALQPAHRRALEGTASFLERRAGLYLAVGEAALARQDYRAAIALQPGQASLRVAYWWMLVDQRETASLRSELARMAARVRNDAAFAEVLAASWQLLDQPQQALAAMQPLARDRANDFLWLMNYADVLERTGREGPALRVRRHAWTVLQQVRARPAQAEQARQALTAQLRLAAVYAGGEQKARLWRELGALLAASQSDPSQRQQAQELVGAWLLSEGRFDTAQRWLWQQQAARMAVPAYQELAVALVQRDPQALAALLDRADARGSQRFDPQDRLSALRELKRRDEAAALGFGLAQQRPEGSSDEAAELLHEDLLAGASRASVQTRVRRSGVVARQEVRTDASIVLSPRLRLTAELTTARDRSLDPLQIAETPARDRELRLGLETSTPWGDLKAQWLWRHAVAAVQGLVLQLSTQLGRQTTLQLELARADRSEESSAMGLAGVRDRAGASVVWRPGDRLEVQGSLGLNRFRTQTGAGLGRSADLALTGNWFWRRDYPDVRTQVQLRRNVVQASGPADAATGFLASPQARNDLGQPEVGLFLGPSSTALSASLGVGLAQSDRSVYSRAWRPWGEIGLEMRRSPTGQQTQGLLRLGAKGTVAGRDQLSVNLDVRPGTGGLSGADGTRELRIQYETFFNR